MTTKNLIIVGVALAAGAWLLSAGSATAANGTDVSRRTGAASGPAVPRRPKVTAATTPTAPVLVGKLAGTNLRTSKPAALDINRVTSGVDNVGRIGTDGPFRGNW